MYSRLCRPFTWRSVQPLFGRRNFALPIPVPLAPPPFPTIESCPAPTCSCRSAPSGLDIDWDQNINGSMAAYAEQVLICTGKYDWPSRIETDTDSVLVRGLKAHLGPRGKYSNPYHNVMVTNSSLPPMAEPAATTIAFTTSHQSREGQAPSRNGKTSAQAKSRSTTSAYLLPSFQYVPAIPTDDAGVEDFIKAFVLPNTLHSSYEILPQAQQDVLLRQTERQQRFVGTRKIDEILVLICGHGQRDERCGKLGPVLKGEFEVKLRRHNVALLDDLPMAEAETQNMSAPGSEPAARVGLISHIGGHKFAGNVIIYIPPSFLANSLAGKGIWYGRVMPEDVEGIITQTIIEGKVIKDKFRGGIDQHAGVLRL